MIDESVIRERAYALWVKDACPEDADLFIGFLLESSLKQHSSELPSRVTCAMETINFLIKSVRKKMK